MSDLIRREDAMQVAFLYPFFSDALMEEIKAIPSVDIPHSDDWEKYSDRLWKNAYERGKADRSQGEWKPFDLKWGREIYACTSCEESVEVPTCMNKPLFKFCPLCGARMKGAE